MAFPELYTCLLINRRRFDQRFGPYQDYKGNILHKCLYDKNEKTDISISNLRMIQMLINKIKKKEKRKNVPWINF